MITSDNLPIIKRKDGSYQITMGNLPYGVDVLSDLHSEVEAYLLEHPESLIPEPLPPEPTQEEKDAMERRRIIGRLAEIDTLAARPMRAILSRTQTDADIEKLTALEAESKELRTQLLA